MASINKVKNQYRVRFFIHLPDGHKKDRSRRIGKLREANEYKFEAEILEAKTRKEEYSDKDVTRWIRLGLISRQDANLLSTYHDGRKTVRQAGDEYRQTWGEISRGEQMAREGRVERIIEILGPDRAIQDIRHLDGERLKTILRTEGAKTRPRGSKALPAKLKAVTVNKYLQDLKRMFNLQVAQRSLEFHPFAMLKGLKVKQIEKITHTALTMDDISRVITVAEEKDKKTRPPLGGNMTLFLLMFFGCGLRRKEAMEARLENIDWGKRTLRINGTKTDKERTVGLGHRLFDLLKIRKGEKGRILPSFHKDTVSRTIIRHFRLCGIKMRLHDTRHTYTTRLLDIGVGKRKAKHRTGHEDERMLDHYDHPEVDEIYEDDFEFMK